MKGFTRRGVLNGATAIGASTLIGSGAARAAYGPGVTDTEIKLGTTSPYSGPASSFGVFGEAQVAFFKMINDKGGINGRKINLISLDNAFSPPKALEQTRTLVEGDGVFAIAGALGTPPNAAIAKYLNDAKVPNLFLVSGAERFNDPKNFPWIIPLYPSYVAQGEIYGNYIKAKKPGAKIAVLYENDDLGKDYVRGLKKGLGDKAASMIVKERSHELSDPSIESIVVEMNATGADVYVQFTTPKFAAQSIRKTAALGWKPLQILASNAASIPATLVPAGLENSRGIISARWEKDITGPEFADDQAIKEFRQFEAKYMPRANPADQTAMPGYICAYAIAEVLRRCGNELTRENLVKMAATLRDFPVPTLLPGITLSNSPDDYSAYHAMEIIQFNGERWVGLGELIRI
ncbi:MAG: ABC transporter substrate-binding protein [Hyphomicrobiales bacterium]|nr:ABC transporter substrate-binding protein [Hyphomicrobiales bacterium]